MTFGLLQSQLSWLPTLLDSTVIRRPITLRIACDRPFNRATLPLTMTPFGAVTRLVLASTNCPKHTRLGETERTWAKLEISAKVGDLDYDCDYER